MSGYMQQVRSTRYLDARDDTLDRQLKKYPVRRRKKKRIRTGEETSESNALPHLSLSLYTSHTLVRCMQVSCSTSRRYPTAMCEHGR